MKFILIFGPPAVGKMAVGKELRKLTDFRLFHNHMTIELLIPIFSYGTSKFRKLNSEFRKRIFEEAATSDLPGFIFTYVWDFNLLKEKEYIDEVSNLFRNNNAEIFYVELDASLEERLKRNKTKDRLLEKPSKRDVELSERRLLKMEKQHKMNTNGDFYYTENYLKINSTELNAKEAAEKIKTVFNF
ncbi:MAG: AAA family ATPase [Candidatus Heimdallarchaeota archaeon]|nr:AAA family ATPase [Candidatus Heimdallarchaeota archaeon]